MGREVETTEYAGMVRRIIRAHGRRVADADPEDLRELHDLHLAVDDAVRAAVVGVRRRHSWAQIAGALGVTKQTAWEKYAAAVLASESTPPE
jgi:hypothetical protein